MRQIDNGTAPVVVDVRSKKEFDEGHVPGAIHLPFWKVGRAVGDDRLGASTASGRVLRSWPPRISRRRRIEAARVQEYFLPRGTYETMERDEASTRRLCALLALVVARTRSHSSPKCEWSLWKVKAPSTGPCGAGRRDRGSSTGTYPDTWSATENVALEEACAGSRQLLSHRLGRQSFSDDGARGRTPRVALWRSADPTARSCGRRSRPTGGQAGRITRTATHQRRRRRTGLLSTRRSAAAAWRRSISTASSSGTRISATSTTITAPPDRRCSTRTASFCIRTLTAARSWPPSTQTPERSCGERRDELRSDGAHLSRCARPDATRSSSAASHRSLPTIPTPAASSGCAMAIRSR